MDANQDLNSGGSVATQDLKDAGTVNQQDLNQSVTGEQDEILADGSKKSDKTVKYEEFEKANAAKKEAEEARVVAEQKLAQAVQLQQQTTLQQQAGQAPQPSSTYELAMQQLGLTADDLYDGNNQLKVQKLKAELDTALQQQQATFATNQQFMASHPDFTQVVGNVDPATGRITAWSSEALLLQQKKPHLAASFQSAQGAYELVMAERRLAELEKNDAANKEHLQRQGVDTNIAPLGGSAAGGGGAGDPHGQQVLTREQLLEIRRKVANGEQV